MAVTGLRAADYEDRLQELGWTTLTERREQADMTLVNGVLASRVNMEPTEWLTLVTNNDRGTRSTADELNLRLAHGRLDTRKNFFTVRVAKPWNSVPSEIKGLKKHYQFKKSYGKWKRT